MMSEWEMFTIRVQEPHEDGYWYPVPSADKNGVVFDLDDGSPAPTVMSKSLHVHVGGKTVIKASEIKADLFITDTRVGLACTKYDKGGGWWGGPTALALNAGSKALAALRRRGKTLVGHIRYPWLVSVLYTTRTGMFSDENIRLTCTVPTKDGYAPLIVTLQLPKTTSAQMVATEITQRAARFKLNAVPNLRDADRAALTNLLNPSPPTPQKNVFVGWDFPSGTSMVVGAEGSLSQP